MVILWCVICIVYDMINVDVGDEYLENVYGCVWLVNVCVDVCVVCCCYMENCVSVGDGCCVDVGVYVWVVCVYVCVCVVCVCVVRCWVLLV